MIAATFFSVSLVVGSAIATNDWSKPCFNGVCSYDSPFGTLNIWGSADAISDITTAGGWSILACSSTALTQDIRLVCHDSSICDYLYQNVDPVGKLVRLPESCGTSAFARVARIWTHENQSMPSSLVKGLGRRDTPQVQGIALDVNFAAIDPAQSGNVNIAIQGANIPGATGDLNIIPVPQRRSRLFGRDLASTVENAFDGSTSFNKNESVTAPAIDLETNTPTFDESVSCDSLGDAAEVKGSISAKAHAEVTLGLVAAGTIIPPTLTNFGIFAGKFHDGLMMMEDLDRFTKTLERCFEVGIPGLDFPGVLSLGPSLQVFVRGIADLDIGANLTMDLNYNVANAQLFFPSSQNHQSGGRFSPTDTPLKIAATPSLAVRGVVEAHLLPTLNMGLSAFDGIAQANVFLELDASASLTLTLDASTTPNITSQNINGCAEINCALEVNAGADASLFDLFSKDTSINLARIGFELVKVSRSPHNHKGFANRAIRNVSVQVICEDEGHEVLLSECYLISVSGNRRPT
ncbi:hypothetical protein C8J56DRAFT_775131 [Mycena floridula]|nr:hypothetical protein C8J56DRAFT_775131 [Mycena floridula]